MIYPRMRAGPLPNQRHRSAMDPVATVGTLLLTGFTLLATLVVLELVLCFFMIPYLFHHYVGVANHGGRVADEDDGDDIESLPTVTYPAAAARATPAGLDPEELDSLPTFAYFAGSGTDPVDCAVCLTQFRENEWLRSLPGCGHCFHAACVDRWLSRNRTCPLCRSPVKPESVVIDLQPVLVLQWGRDPSSPPLSPTSPPSPSSLRTSGESYGRPEAGLEWVKRRILRVKRALGAGWRFVDQL